MNREKIDIDFRLLDISIEIYAIKNHFDIIENQIKYIEQHQKEIIEKTIEEENLSFNSPDWHELVNSYEQKIHIELPRFFRNTFLGSLYSVFESAVLEIARNIQKKKSIELSLKDVEVRTFLNKAKQYYEEELDFTLYNKNSDWQNINVLSDLRNAIAHSNGRLEPLTDSLRTKIRKHSKNGFAIIFTVEYFIVEKELAERLLNSVVYTLKDLVDRYKKWDGE